MRKYSLLLLLLLTTAFSYAQNVVQGNVSDVNSQPVASHVVYITDTMNVFPPAVNLTCTTDAAGNYFAPLPVNLSPGTILHVSTASCGIMLMNTHVFQSSSITSNFTICATTGPVPDTVSGMVFYGNGTPAGGGPAFPAIVYLIEQDFDSANNIYNLNLLDSGYTTQTGDYMFTVVQNSARPLLVKAALLPTNSNYAGYLPSYHFSALNWSNANAVSSFVPGVNSIQMIPGVNPGGPGFIGGSVLQGANKTTGVGDPLDKRLLLLTTINDVAVAYTYSDGAGSFSFSNLAYGSYKLFGDAMGKLNPALIVTLDATTPSVTNILFEENSGDFTGQFTTGVVTPSALSDLHIYPNPATDVLNISGMDKIGGQKTVAVTDVNGAVVWTGSTTKGQLAVPVGGLAAGLYMVQVRTDSGTAIYKMIR